MSDDVDEWGPWIQHDGNGCPPEVFGRTVDVYFRPDKNASEDAWRRGVFFVDDLMASCCSWCGAEYDGKGVRQYWDGIYDLPGGPHWVDRYRVRKPRGMKVLQELVANPPEMPVMPEKVDA